MSAATEIAEREAAEAEAENPDTEPVEPIEEPTPEPLEEPAPEPESSSLTVIKDLDKKLTAEASRHSNALAKLHPDDWDRYAMCPLCIGDGYLLPIEPGQQPEELWEATKALAGRAEQGGLETAPWAKVCEVCSGKGVLLTGAQTEHGFTIPCKRCVAKGWYDPSDPSTYQNVAPPASMAAPLVVVPPGGEMNQPIEGQQYSPPAGWIPGNGINGNDNWGRWQGHPRYGIDTQYTGGTW